MLKQLLLALKRLLRALGLAARACVAAGRWLFFFAASAGGATGSNRRVPRASASRRSGLKDIGDSGGRIAGDSESAWIVLDLYDVIVHVFLPEAREYYDIEALWRK